MCASNRCNCPNPPGGMATCPADCIAVCVVEDGKAFTHCLVPDDRLSRVLRLGFRRSLFVEKWLLQRLAERLGAGDISIDLRGGTATARDGAVRITFRLPGNSDLGEKGVRPNAPRPVKAGPSGKAQGLEKAPVSKTTQLGRPREVERALAD